MSRINAMKKSSFSMRAGRKGLVKLCFNRHQRDDRCYFFPLGKNQARAKAEIKRRHSGM